MEEKMKCLEAMDFMKDWTTWRETLHQAIKSAKSLGMSDESIKTLSKSVGDFLAEKICPSTKEEELLKEMWDIGTEEERKVIASLIFKMVQ